MASYVYVLHGVTSDCAHFGKSWHAVIVKTKYGGKIATFQQRISCTISINCSRSLIQNAMFVGPVLTVPLMLLAVYGIGCGPIEIPVYLRIIMSLSFLRYGLEGIIAATYGYDRGDTVCPDAETFCMFKKSDYLKDFLGFHDADYGVSMAGLGMYYVLFTVAAFFMIKIRISTTGANYVAVQYLGRFVKTHLNFSSYSY